MHHLYYVAIPKEGIGDNKGSKLVAEVVSARLEEEGFIDSEKFFSTARADWFVVGGRWSGILQSVINSKLDWKAFENYRTKSHNKTTAEIQKKWKEVGGEGPNPTKRNQREAYGYDDDVLSVGDPEEHQQLTDFLKARHAGGEVEVLDIFEWEEMYTDEFAKRDFQEPYYLVAIDYHN